MKQRKSGGIGSLIFNIVMGAFIAFIIGAPILFGAVAGFLLGFIPRGHVQTSTLMAGVNKEIWIATIMEKFYPVADWLSRVTDLSAFVEFNTINLADAGVDPTVLIDNSSYPISTAARTDNPLALPLKTLDTENTLVRNVEEMEAAYDKMSSVIRGHQNALRTKCYELSAWNYGPQSDSADHPVISATGADNGDGLTAAKSEDLVKMAKLFDNKNFPQENRVAVLTPQHWADLINDNKTLYNQYVNLAEGKILRYAGWDLFKFSINPRYNKSTLAKTTFTAAAAGTDSVGSIFFCGSEVMKADGTFDMFNRLRDPEQRGDIIGFQKRFLALAIRSKAIGALVSVDV